MMIAEASVLVHAPLDRIREAVLDPDAYINGQTKVQEMFVESRQGDQLVARINGHLGPFRSHIRARYTIGQNKVDLQMLWGRLRGFHAVFLMEPQPGVSCSPIGRSTTLATARSPRYSTGDSRGGRLAVCVRRWRHSSSRRSEEHSPTEQTFGAIWAGADSQLAVFSRFLPKCKRS